MKGIVTYFPDLTAARYIVLDGTDRYTCSFTEFSPFCAELYYFSSYKDFNTFSQA